MPTRIIIPIMIVMALVLCPLSGRAALREENLLAPVPSGFKVGSSVKNERSIIQEFVPSAETVENWSRMATVQIFLGSAQVAPDTFANSLAGRWTASCPDGTAVKFHAGVENGFPVSLWTFSCPLNPATKKPETMYLKAIGGSDSLYVVQYAYRQALSQALVGPAVEYLRQVRACDTRRADRRCPAGM